jgi:hypothetical protein
MVCFYVLVLFYSRVNGWKMEAARLADVSPNLLYLLRNGGIALYRPMNPKRSIVLN